MIPAPPLVKLTVFVVSLGLHAAVLLWWFVAPSVEIAGSSGAVVEARLGNSFTDLAAGAADPKPPPEVQPEKPTEPEASPTVPEPAVTPPTPVEAAHVPETAKVARAVETRQALPQVPAAVTPELATVPLLNAEPLETPEQGDPVQPTKPVAPEPVTAQAVEPNQTPPPQKPTPETEPLEATIPAAVETSLRPTVRPDRPIETPKPQTARATPQGNSQQNAVAGSASGNRSETVRTQSGSTGRTAESGNAAVSNYPGKVMRKISRVSKPRTGSRGTAVVRFSITNSGALQALSVARSSGSARLDQAALQIIRRAAPFPKPPPGAQTSFSISIQGRG